MSRASWHTVGIVAGDGYVGRCVRDGWDLIGATGSIIVLRSPAGGYNLLEQIEGDDYWLRVPPNFTALTYRLRELGLEIVRKPEAGIRELVEVAP